MRIAVTVVVSIFQTVFTEVVDSCHCPNIDDGVCDAPEIY